MDALDLLVGFLLAAVDRRSTAADFGEVVQLVADGTDFTFGWAGPRACVRVFTAAVVAGGTCG